MKGKATIAACEGCGHMTSACPQRDFVCDDHCTTCQVSVCEDTSKCEDSCTRCHVENEGCYAGKPQCSIQPGNRPCDNDYYRRYGSDDELPGMWSYSDFTGGPDECTHCKHAILFPCPIGRC